MLCIRNGHRAALHPATFIRNKILCLVSVVSISKVLLELLDGIFIERFLNKKVDKIKNVKNVFLHLWMWCECKTVSSVALPLVAR